MARQPAARSSEWSRRYLPLLTVAMAVLLAVYTLPSALNLPQANPGSIAQYAPVPGNSGTSPPGGNFAGLGLGEGGSAEGGGGQAAGVAAQGQPVSTTFNCVGNPPRQTEDPLSPPCVPVFTGDNGGATYRGVTANEIRVVFYFDGDQTQAPTGQGSEQSPNNEYDDIDAAPKSSDDVLTRGLRVMERYFDSRYQTYRRHVHFLAYYTDQLRYGNSGGVSSQTRIEDAQATFARTQPFAAFGYPVLGYGDSYEYAMAQHGVLNFGGTELRQAAFYQQYPGLIWGFQPTVEEIARMYSSYVCTKLKTNPVSFAGDGSMLDRPRKFGLLYTTDPSTPGLTQLGKLVQRQLAGCGINLGGDVATFPYAGWNVDSHYTADYAVTNMATFKQDKVTTVLWPAGFETNQSNAASKEQYYPEWVQGGDYRMEGDDAGAAQSPDEWRHAWAVTPAVPVPPSATDTNNPVCEQALRSVDPGMNTLDMSYACPMYDDVRELFTGIQVAGPRLMPSSMDQGFHAIPPHLSTGPYAPACYFDPGDYTCVKDGVAEWFDPTAPQAWSSGTGCWRLAAGGQRYSAGRWPPGQVPAQDSGDPCTNYSTGYLIT